MRLLYKSSANEINADKMKKSYPVSFHPRYEKNIVLMILAIIFSFRKGGRHHVFIVSTKQNSDNQYFPTINCGSWIFYFIEECFSRGTTIHKIQNDFLNVVKMFKDKKNNSHEFMCP